MQLKLGDGASIPQIGLGTWQLKGNQCTRVVREALSLGYRHIDTAHIYGNHEAIAPAIKDFDRKELFITSKAWREDLSYKGIIASGKRACEQLGIDYLDLFLIHWPNEDYPLNESLEAMEKLKKQGIIRSFGVSNFTTDLINDVLDLDHPVATNQVETHIHHIDEELVNLCTKHHIPITAYSPLAQGNLDDEVLTTIAKKHQVSPAQIALHYLILRGFIVIPKSSSTKHLKSNLEVFDIRLSDDEVEQLKALNDNSRQINPSFAPWN